MKRVQIVLSSTDYPQGLMVERLTRSTFRVDFYNVPHRISFHFEAGEEFVVRMVEGRLEFGRWFECADELVEQLVEHGPARQPASPRDAGVSALARIVQWLRGSR